MWGHNTELKNNMEQQNTFYKQLSEQYATVFGQNQAITGALTSAFKPILEAGPSQEGFSPGQRTAMETQNTENVTTDYAQQQMAQPRHLAQRAGRATHHH